MTAGISFFLHNVLLASGFVDRSTTIITAKTENASKPMMSMFTKILKLMTFQLKTHQINDIYSTLTSCFTFWCPFSFQLLLVELP